MLPYFLSWTWMVTRALTMQYAKHIICIWKIIHTAFTLKRLAQSYWRLAFSTRAVNNIWHYILILFQFRAAVNINNLQLFAAIGQDSLHWPPDTSRDQALSESMVAPVKYKTQTWQERPPRWQVRDGWVEVSIHDVKRNGNSDSLFKNILEKGEMSEGWVTQRVWPSGSRSGTTASACTGWARTPGRSCAGQRIRVFTRSATGTDVHKRELNRDNNIKCI